MVSLGVIVLYILVDHAPVMLPTEENLSIKAFEFDRSHEALSVRVQIRAFRRKLDATNADRRAMMFFRKKWNMIYER